MRTTGLPGREARRARHRAQGSRVGAWVVLLLMFSSGTGLVAAAAPFTAPAYPSSTAVENLSVETTAQFSFVPNRLTVTPGASVHLVVTQEATFPHTFVLSSLVNVTIPTTDDATQLDEFFTDHPPLVNLSLPGTPGVQAFANFTAPPVGTYEFVCAIPGHFQAGMYGFLDSTSQTASASASGGVPPALIVGGAVAGVVVVVAVVLLAVRRRSRRSPPPPPPS